MVRTVLEHESFLFSEEELSFFTAYRTLSCESNIWTDILFLADDFLDKARYLLARLLVRKTGKWYRVDQLKYVAELGSEGIVDAISELCGALRSKSEPASSSQVSQCSPGERSALGSPPNKRSSDPDRRKTRLNFYAEDETVASLSDLLCCLSLEELKSAARTLKLPNTLTAVSPRSDSVLSYLTMPFTEKTSHRVSAINIIDTNHTSQGQT